MIDKQLLLSILLNYKLYHVITVVSFVQFDFINDKHRSC